MEFQVGKIYEHELFNDYTKNIQNIDELNYFEITFLRDRSSFGGAGIKVVDKCGIFLREPFKEVVYKEDKYDKYFIGLSDEYLLPFVQELEKMHLNKGLEIVFLTYSDVKSSPMIFKQLAEQINDYLQDKK